MPREIPVAPVSEIPPGTSRRVNLGATDIAVFNLGGDRFVACRDECPHRAVSLTGAHVSGSVVTCPGHAWEFDLAREGACVKGETDVKLRLYPVHIVEGVVHVSA